MPNGRSPRPASARSGSAPSAGTGSPSGTLPGMPATLPVARRWRAAAREGGEGEVRRRGNEGGKGSGEAPQGGSGGEPLREVASRGRGGLSRGGKLEPWFACLH